MDISAFSSAIRKIRRLPSNDEDKWQYSDNLRDKDEGAVKGVLKPHLALIKLYSVHLSFAFKLITVILPPPQIPVYLLPPSVCLFRLLFIHLCFFAVFSIFSSLPLLLPHLSFWYFSASEHFLSEI